MSKRPRGGRKNLIDILAALSPDKNREWLYSRILHGDVYVDGHRERDPRRLLSPDADVGADFLDLPAADSSDTIHRRDYVSRGGAKLESVLSAAESAGFQFRDRVVLDAGASTGGFSDCLLRHGAREIHAVDVGYNQLDYRLRRDSRVHVHERCNIMSLSPGDLDPLPVLAVADLSFRSMEGVAAHILALLDPEHTGRPLLLGLIKPQFELEYSGLTPEGFSGVLDDPALLEQVLKDTRRRLEGEGLEVLGSWPAGITGAGGNQEYFWLMTRG